MNPVILPEDGPERGLLPAAAARSEAFLARYERKVLFYDVFWDAERRRIIAHGPPPIDLAPHYRAARYVAQPSGVELRPKPHHSKLVHLLAFAAPPDTTHLDIAFAGRRLGVAVNENHSDAFAGRNLLFTLSKDNDLAWIEDWARFHVVNQAVDAVCLFDNGSTRYTLADIEKTLLAVDGLERVAVVPAPFRYPVEDAALPENIFWAHFLQPSVIVNMFRRYGMKAAGILNCDIDELAVPLAPGTVFDAARQARSGTVYFRGCWIEPVPEAPRDAGYRHRDFRSIIRGTDYRRGPTNKWALAPDRRWLADLGMHPYPHAVENRPLFTRKKPGTAYIAHFKAISTGWKYDRSPTSGSTEPLETDAPLAAAMDKAFGGR